MNRKKPYWFIPSVALTLDELWAMARNPNAVFSYKPGYSEIYFVQVPSVSALHYFRT